MYYTNAKWAKSQRLTFEVTGHQRQDAKPGPVKMYRVPPARAWWPAVGAPVDRRVRQRCDSVPSAMHVAVQLGVTDWPAGLTASRSAPTALGELVFGAAAAESFASGTYLGCGGPTT